MKRRASSLDFPSGENNLVSPRTSPTSSSLPLDVYSRKNIFSRQERPGCVTGDILPVNNPSSASPLDSARPLTRLFATPSLRRFPPRGETRRKHVCAISRADPSLLPAVDGSLETGGGREEDSMIREKTLRMSTRVCALNGSGERANVLFGREDRSFENSWKGEDF